MYDFPVRVLKIHGDNRLSAYLKIYCGGYRLLVVAGVADNGELVIHDPNSPANSARTWDAERVLAQCANLWAFERG